MTTQTFTSGHIEITNPQFVDHAHGGGSVTITATTKGGVIPMFRGDAAASFVTLSRECGKSPINQGAFECGAGTIRVYVTANASPTASHPVTVTIS